MPLLGSPLRGLRNKARLQFGLVTFFRPDAGCRCKTWVLPPTPDHASKKPFRFDSKTSSCFDTHTNLQEEKVRVQTRSDPGFASLLGRPPPSPNAPPLGADALPPFPGTHPNRKRTTPLGTSAACRPLLRKKRTQHAPLVAPLVSELMPGLPSLDHTPNRRGATPLGAAAARRPLLRNQRSTQSRSLLLTPFGGLRKFEKVTTFTTCYGSLLLFTTLFHQNHLDPLFRAVSQGSRVTLPGFPGAPGVSSQKVQKVP